ncbi:potassium transporter TrkA [Micromonospora rifamycinica]|uniref:potassium transporter TrkA n=1 Tax=Micromonospora rifamycinica TaxID=291594 RepID=UPI002E2E641F|nr:potassium transporter TrkA [Micromonospora rifamycinica]
MRFERTVLPGVGLCQRFATANGQWASVISHPGGRRDVVIYHPEDGDTALATLVLDQSEAQAFAAVLNQAVTVDHLAELERQLPGVTVVRIPVAVDSVGDGKRWRDTGLSGRPLSLLAVVRAGRVVPTPGDDFVLLAGDEVAVAGTEAATTSAADVLAGH